ncbi:MAG: CHAT domain-containing tetratricopeptide repeat protein [Cyanobacteriota bacterium]|nr:CHAT domain-containing tetratricopeptide repeat protein [Cyanobacteriota bacterium]
MRRISSLFSKVGQFFLFWTILIIIGIPLGLLGKLFPPLGRKIGEITQKYSGNDSNANPEDRAELQEGAIATHEWMLQFVSRKIFPIQWAALQNKLGVAYENRIKGDKAENLEKAIAAFHQALQIYTKETFPTDWANTQNNLGCAYTDRIKGEKSENIEKAIAALDRSLEVNTREAFPYKWTNTQNNLGAAYYYRILGNKAKNIELAIAAFHQALQIYTKETFPTDWANTQNNLGNAYLYRIKGDKAENIEKAIAVFEHALEVNTREVVPDKWANTQHNLAAAYRDRILGERAKNIELAIVAEERALQIYTKEAFPTDWAITQNNLGLIYRARILGDRAENIEKAIAANKLALEIRTKEALPSQWAISNNNLGLAYLDRIKGDKAENIELAIAAFGRALEVNTREAFPYKWANTQTALGAAYYERIEGDKTENIEKTIAAYEKALSIRTRQALPHDWANTQHNLGCAYLDRIKGDKAENIEKAIAAYEKALEIRTKQAFPYEWAKSQHNLGCAFWYRIKGDKAENIELAIASHQNALSVRTPKANPFDCLNTAGSLGNLHFSQQNWQQAIDTYETAIAAVELLREWASTDARREEILEEAIDVYQKLIQSYLNIDQPQKALITVERAKSRNLVELAVSRNLLPQGDIPPKLLRDLNRLRRQLQATSQQLNSSSSNSPSGIQTSEPPEAGELRQQQQQQTLQQRQQLELELQESRQELDLVLDDIKQIDPSFSLTQRVEAISFAEIQELVADGETAIVEWYLTGQTLVAFIVSQEGLNIHQYSTADLKKLKKRTDAYLRLYNRKGDRPWWREQLPQRLQNFAEILHIEEIFAQIPTPCQGLILIPHLDLYLLPLHALPLGDKPLIDLFPKGVRYAPSCQLLQLVQKRQRPHFHNLLAIQTPTPDLEGRDCGATNAIKQQFTNPQILPNASAKKSQLLQHPQLPKAHNLFFFCHGNFNLASPLDSYLQLADDNLTLGDILAHLDLKNCRLVTLSACETALTDHQKVTDNYVGLPSGFLLAGSTNVLATLWRVQPLPTAIFTVKFYQELQNHDNMAVALDRARAWLRDSTISQFREWLPHSQISSAIQRNLKLKLLTMARNNEEEKPFAAPYYWAAFCLIGKGE